MSNDPRNRAPTEDPPYKVYRSGEERQTGTARPRGAPLQAYRSTPKGCWRACAARRTIAEPRRGATAGGARRAGRRPGGAGLRGRGLGRAPRLPWWRRRWTARRVLKYVVLAIVAWLLLSLVLFLVSASIQSGSVPDSVYGGPDARAATCSPTPTRCW